MHLLLCDGPLNGQWYTIPAHELEPDLSFLVDGHKYFATRWPTGEWVGVWSESRDSEDSDN